MNASIILAMILSRQDSVVKARMSEVADLVFAGQITGVVLEIEKGAGGHGSPLVRRGYPEFRVRLEIINGSKKKIDLRWMTTVELRFDDLTRLQGMAHIKEKDSGMSWAFTPPDEGERIIKPNEAWTGNFFAEGTKTMSPSATIKGVYWTYPYAENRLLEIKNKRR